MPTTETVLALEQAAEGLTYQSETDAPWSAVSWPAATGELTAEGVRRLGRHKADAPTAEMALADFFGPLVQEQDWFGDEEKAIALRYGALLDAVQKHLRNAKVVRIGETRVAVYVLGQAPEGGWAGLKTLAVET